MWSLGDSRSGGSDNDLPPSSPLCECRREKLCVSICTVNECVFVCVCYTVCVCNDVDGQNIVQTDNENCESAITGHYRKNKPNPSILWDTVFVSLYTVSLNIQFHLCTLKGLITFTDMWINLHITKPSHVFISFCFSYTHTETRPCPYSDIYSVRDTQLFADASQRLQYHCCDDLLNGEWYHTRLRA